MNEQRFNRYVNLGIAAEDMYLRLGGDVDRRDLKPYSYPPLSDLLGLGYRSVCLGSYIPWDQKQSNIIKEDLGWEGDQVENVPAKYDYEKLSASCKT